jgi:hypothetical protein
MVGVVKNVLAGAAQSRRKEWRLFRPPDPAAHAPGPSTRSSSGSASTRTSGRLGPADGPASKGAPEIPGSWPGLGLAPVGQLRGSTPAAVDPANDRSVRDNATFTNSLRGRGPLVTWHFICVVSVPRRRAGRPSVTRPERNWLPSNWRTYGRRNHNMPCQQRPQDEGSERRLSRHTPSSLIRCLSPSAASHSMGFMDRVTPR